MTCRNLIQLIQITIVKRETIEGEAFSGDVSESTCFLLLSLETGGNLAKR